jgi:hypothetical protein
MDLTNFQLTDTVTLTQGIYDIFKTTRGDFAVGKRVGLAFGKLMPDKKMVMDQ